MTIEECEKVFYGFANEDPDGNGVKDTYALSKTGMNPIFGAFGALPDRWCRRTAARLWRCSSGHEGCADTGQWYKDGLIDPEFITGENQGGYWALSVPFENGQIGFSSSGAYYHLAPTLDGPKDEATGKGGAFQFGRTMRTFAATVGYDKMVIGYNPTGPDGKQGGESWGLTTDEAMCSATSWPISLRWRASWRLSKPLVDYETWLKVWLWI